MYVLIGSRDRLPVCRLFFLFKSVYIALYCLLLAQKSEEICFIAYKCVRAQGCRLACDVCACMWVSTSVCFSFCMYVCKEGGGGLKRREGSDAVGFSKSASMQKGPSFLLKQLDESTVSHRARFNTVLIAGYCRSRLERNFPGFTRKILNKIK